MSYKPFDNHHSFGCLVGTISWHAMSLDCVVVYPFSLLMIWNYIQQLIDMDLKARRGLINHSHVRREWSRMPIGLENLIEESHSFGGSNLSLSSGSVGENGLLIPSVRRNWLWPRQNNSDRLHTCARWSRCPGWKRDRRAPYIHNDERVILNVNLKFW